jgi:hypothetical protein
VLLRGAEHERLLALVDRVHEQLHAVRLALADLDDAVEVPLDVRRPDSTAPSTSRSSLV